MPLCSIAEIDPYREVASTGPTITLACSKEAPPIRAGRGLEVRSCGTPAGHARRVSHAPISVNRPGVEFYVVSSDQGRPQSRPRRARSAVAPPSSSRRAVPRYICRRCVVHALTRVKLFLDRTWASLVQLQRTGPFVAAIYQSPPRCLRGH